MRLLTERYLSYYPYTLLVSGSGDMDSNMSSGRQDPGVSE